MAETRTTSSTGGEKGTKLARFDLIPQGPLRELAEHFGIGAAKYADHQWRKGYEWSKSFAALSRHLSEFWAGKDYDVCSNDPKGCSHVDVDGDPFVAVREDACFNHTGSHHMAAAAWHAFALLEFKDQFPEHDDRHKPEPKRADLGFSVRPMQLEEEPPIFYRYFPGGDFEWKDPEPRTKKATEDALHKLTEASLAGQVFIGPTDEPRPKTCQEAVVKAAADLSTAQEARDEADECEWDYYDERLEDAEAALQDAVADMGELGPEADVPERPTGLDGEWAEIGWLDEVQIFPLHRFVVGGDGVVTQRVDCYVQPVFEPEGPRPSAYWSEEHATGFGEFDPVDIEPFLEAIQVDLKRITDATLDALQGYHNRQG